MRSERNLVNYVKCFGIYCTIITEVFEIGKRVAKSVLYYKSPVGCRKKWHGKGHHLEVYSSGPVETK